VRVTVTDVVSPSYFVLTAAVELGYLAAEGLAAEFILPPREASQELRDGALDLYGGSPYVGLMAFPEWRGGKLLCALSQGAYWTLAIRADLGVKRGDVDAIKGRRILAGGGPAIALKRILAEAGIDLERDGVQIVAPPWPPEPNANQARLGARAIEEGLADAFWGNSMRAEWAMRKGLATVLLDIRQGDGPPSGGHGLAALRGRAARRGGGGRARRGEGAARPQSRSLVGCEGGTAPLPAGRGWPHCRFGRPRCAVLRPDDLRGCGRRHCRFRAGSWSHLRADPL
jgi:hypothetical protein